MAGRVRVKTVRKTLANKDVQALFQQAMGGESDGGALAYAVVWPKFKRVRHAAGRAVKVCGWLAGRDWLAEAFPDEHAQMTDYFDRLRQEHADAFGAAPDLDAYADAVSRRLSAADPSGELAMTVVPDFAEVPGAELQAFSEAYRPAMKSDLVNTIINVCSNLTKHKASLHDATSLKPRFLRSSGLRFDPFPELPAANFMAFYNHQDLAEHRDTILYYLHKVYHATHELYEAVSMPDIDVEEFVEVVVASIDQVQKHMGRECREAFQTLRSSVQLLRENFGTYIHDVQESGNANVMMQNFVMDVAKGTGNVKPHVKGQFAKIIGFYRKQAAVASKDPKSQALFDELDKNLKELDRHQRGSPDDVEEEEDDEAGADGADGAADAAEAADAAADAADAADEDGAGDDVDRAFAAAAAGDARCRSRRAREAVDRDTLTTYAEGRTGVSQFRPSRLLAKLKAEAAGADA